MTAYDSDIEDILGGGPDKPLPHGGLKPVPSRAARQAADQIKLRAEASKPDSMSAVSVKNGVTVAWLAAVFGKSTEWVRQRLVDCPKAGQNGRAFTYHVKEAAEYLVDPKLDIAEYLRNMKHSELPAALQKEIWDARLKRQKWEAAAGELWHTQDVMAVLSSTFALIKSTVQLWPDTVERQQGLTDEQRALLIRLGDTLQDEVYQGLLGAAKQRSTQASISDLDDEEASTEIVLDDDDEELEDVL